MRRRPGAIQHAQAGIGATATQADVDIDLRVMRGRLGATQSAQADDDIDSGAAPAATGTAAPAARGIAASAASSTRTHGAVQDAPEGPGRREQPRPAARAESAEEALVVQAGRTVVLNRYTLKALQQQCRDLHIKVGGSKEEVVRRLAIHMMHQDCVQHAASGATLGTLGMSQYFDSEGHVEAEPSSDAEDLATERRARRRTNGTDLG